MPRGRASWCLHVGNERFIATPVLRTKGLPESVDIACLGLLEPPTPSFRDNLQPMIPLYQPGEIHYSHLCEDAMGLS